MSSIGFNPNRPGEKKIDSFIELQREIRANIKSGNYRTIDGRCDLLELSPEFREKAEKFMQQLQSGEYKVPDDTNFKIKNPVLISSSEGLVQSDFHSSFVEGETDFDFDRLTEIEKAYDLIPMPNCKISGWINWKLLKNWMQQLRKRQTCASSWR